MEIVLIWLLKRCKSILTLFLLRQQSQCTPSSPGAWSLRAWPPPAVAGSVVCCCTLWQFLVLMVRWASVPVSSWSLTLKPTVLTSRPSCGPTQEGRKDGEKKRRMQHTVFRTYVFWLTEKLKLLKDYQRISHKAQHWWNMLYWPLSFLLPQSLGKDRFNSKNTQFRFVFEVSWKSFKQLSLHPKGSLGCSGLISHSWMCREFNHVHGNIIHSNSLIQYSKTDNQNESTLTQEKHKSYSSEKSWVLCISSIIIVKNYLTHIIRIIHLSWWLIKFELMDYSILHTWGETP